MSTDFAKKPPSLLNPRFAPAGDTAVVVEFGDRIDPQLSDAVAGLAEALRRSPPAGLVDLMPSFRSLLVHYDPLQTSGADLVEAIMPLLGTGQSRAGGAKLWTVPACYDATVAPDLEAVAQATGLSEADVVEAHVAETYQVYMIGFLPGFPYMGDVTEALRLPRKATPSSAVPAGSVALAQAMTAIYPVSSPGGWHLIARSPISLFDLQRDPPSLLTAGDRVRFEPISLDQLETLGSRFQPDFVDVEAAS